MTSSSNAPGRMPTFSTNSTVEDVLETVARNICEAERAFADETIVDDNEHIPRLRRIVEATTQTARELDVAEQDIEALRARLESVAEDGYVRTWLSELYEDEDPQEEREEASKVFRHVWNGGRR